MSAEEEYLDRLLAQAMQPKKSNNDKGAVAEKKEVAKAPVFVSEDKPSGAAKSPNKQDDIFAGKSFGNKDFTLDDVDAEQLAKEIADFEADADESILPGITDSAEHEVAHSTVADTSREDALPEEALNEDVLNDEALTGEAILERITPEGRSGAVTDAPVDKSGAEKVSQAESVSQEEFSEEALLAALNETGTAVFGTSDVLVTSDLSASSDDDIESSTVGVDQHAPEGEPSSAGDDLSGIEDILAGLDAGAFDDLESDDAGAASEQEAGDTPDISSLEAALDGIGTINDASVEGATEEAGTLGETSLEAALGDIETIDDASIEGVTDDAGTGEAPSADDIPDISSLEAALDDIGTIDDASVEGATEEAGTLDEASLEAALGDIETIDDASIEGVTDDAGTGEAPSADDIPDISSLEAALDDIGTIDDASVEGVTEEAGTLDEASLEAALDDIGTGDDTSIEGATDDSGALDEAPPGEAANEEVPAEELSLEAGADESSSLDMDDLADTSDLGDIASMDLDDIEARLAEAEAAGNEEIQVPGADGDITDIIGAMDGADAGLDDIKGVLDKSDQNIAVDASLFDEPDIPDPLAALEAEQEAEDAAAAAEASGKKGKKEKKKKDKKGGFFANLFKKKKKVKEAESASDGSFPDEDDLDLTSKLDPDDFVQDAADMPREESDEAVAAMFSGLDSIFSDNGEGVQNNTDEGSADDLPSLDGINFDDESDDTPSANGSDSNSPETSVKKGGSGGIGDDDASQDESAEDGTDKKKKKDKKEKKDNIFKKLFAALLEDPDEDLAAVPEESETKLSEENKQILSELNGEEEEKPKKGKKKKQPKEKKEKKPKVKKPKKEKVKKPEEPGLKIPKKYKIRTFAAAGSVLAALLVLTILVPSANVMRSARAAYYDNNYKDAFISMYGKDLNESDKLIYDRSRTIILLDRKYESYVQYKAMGMRDKALDSLLQGLARYDDLKDLAERLDVLDTLNATRGKILEALWDEYSISEVEALEVLGYSPADYSGKVKAAAEGLPYVTIEEQIAGAYNNISVGGETNENDVVPETPDNGSGEELYPDLLPEEQEYMEGNRDDDSGEPETVTAPEENEKKREGYGEKQDGTNVQVEIDSDQF